MCKNSGFRSRIQKSYKKFGIESKNLIIFSESIPNLYPPLLPWAHTDRTDLTGFLCGWEILWMLSDPLLPWAHTDHTDLIGFLCGWEISRMLYGLWFFVGSHGSHRSHSFFCGWEISRRLYGLWFFVGSHRFNEIQQEDYLWKFVISWQKKTPI